MSSENKAFRGINFADLQTAYRQFCKNKKVTVPAVDLAEVIDHYNKAAADLPGHTKLKGIKLPGASVVLDRKGERFAEVRGESGACSLICSRGGIAEQPGRGHHSSGARTARTTIAALAWTMPEFRA